MKKYIVLIALIAATGCGGGENENILTTTETEITSEQSTEEYSKDITENDVEETTIEVNEEDKTKSNNMAEAENKADKDTESFESSKTYNDLKSLASNAGFEINHENNNVTFKIYITDDTIDYIESKDSEYQNKWNENCGLYEEFCSEAIRVVKNNGAKNINIALEVVGRSDNQVYYRNENGTSIYDAYVHENEL